MKSALLFLLAFSASVISFGQGRWVSHTSQNALPSTNVRDVLVDSKGNKWFATDNGLAKFDGNTWSTFQMAYLQLQNKNIYAITEDLKGNIWIVTAQDVEVYDGESWTYYGVDDGLYQGAYNSIKADKSGNVWLGHSQGMTVHDGDKFKNISRINDQNIKDVRDIELDQAGNPWVSFLNAATNRANVAVFKDGVWQIFNHDKFGSEAFTPLSLSFANSKIWAGSPQGFYYFEAGSFLRFEANTGMANPGLNGNIVEDGSGNLWFIRGAAVGGAFKFDPVAKTWAKHDLNGAAFSSAGIDGHTIWFGAAGAGVYKVNSDENTWHNITIWDGLPYQSVGNIFIDNTNRPWLMDGWTSSVYKLYGSDWKEFKSNEYYRASQILMQDIRGGIWYSKTGGGVSVENQGKITNYNTDNSLLPGKAVKEAASDKIGNSYFAFFDKYDSDGQVIMFDGKKWYNITTSHTALTGDSIKIVPTSDGKVWFFSSAGTVVKEGSQWSAAENFSAESYPVTYAVADDKGGFWLGFATGKLVHYSGGSTIEYNLLETLGDNNTKVWFQINGITIDSNGHTWVGGYGTDGKSYTKYPGLYRFDGKRWDSYSKTDKLALDDVLTVKADKIGNVWVGTQKGLSQLILFSEVVTVNTSNISCHGGNDGSIQLIPEGGNAPYQYSIDGGATFVTDNVFNKLTAGDYHVIVKDGKGNTAHNEIIKLTQPAGVFTWEVTPVSCAGAGDGAIKLTVQSNGAEIRYVWHDAAGVQIATTKDIAALAGGAYRVTATYGDCSVTKSITVPEPEPLKATLDYLNSCGTVGGQVTVRVTGGTAPFRYSIDGGVTFQTNRTFTALAAGSYKVQVQDAKGCSFTSESITIVQEERPVPVIVATGSLALCMGNSVWLKTKQAYESYEWYDGNGKLVSTQDSLQVTTAGAFYAVVYQNRCQATSNTLTTTMAATYSQQTVCIVTVDDATRKNKIVWSKIDGKHIASYNIYRETGTNQFTLIGNVPYKSNNYFIDPASSPMTASERYSISIVDICGRESAKSPAHKTIYLQANLGVNNSVNLSWDNYEGFSYTQVNVLRGSSVDNLQLLATRPANNNTFTDTSPNSEQMVYVIEAVTDYSCGETTEAATSQNLRTQQQKASTRSNPSSAKGPLGVEDELIANAGLKVFPNPSAAAITIELRPGKSIHQVRLLNITGGVAQEQYIRGGKSSVLLEPKVKAGIYMLEVKDEQAQVYRQKVMLQ